VVVNAVFFGLSYQTSFKDYLIYLLFIPVGIGITHIYKIVITGRRFFTLKKLPLSLVYILAFSFLKAFVFLVIIFACSRAIGLDRTELTLVALTANLINYSVIFCLWNIIYYGFKYFQNYKLAEINSLRYLATSKESELNNLKAQLNPHFMFNSMNSIRALIDEDPKKAKQAITQLSGILRNTLLINKKREILMREEIELVKDYLNLEHIRYEERLSYELKIDDALSDCKIPPFIIQSQVENAIKHGISRHPGNGNILIESYREKEAIHIKVSNSGKLNSGTPETGVGFQNSKQRLELLYGQKAQISIAETDNAVLVHIIIPFM
jgi:two-component system, LytTR family, sensor kinase